MDEDKKRRFDAIHSLSEQAWRDWDHKTKHEWKLSFGIWATLVAAAAAALEHDVKVKPGIVWSVGILIVLVHLYFLSWIQSRLNFYKNKRIRIFEEELITLTGIELKSKPHKYGLPEASPLTQIIITCLLAGLTVYIYINEYMN